jgi:hypothetical protein
MPTYQIRRKGRVYVAEEATYATAPGLAATDAVRHLSAQLNHSPRNRVNAPTRHVHPSQVYRRTRRQTATWSMRGELFPSGALNTLPDMDPILEHGMGGTTRNVTLATTVSASPSPTTTVFTVSSVTGLAVKDAILITIAAGAFAGKYIRWITEINTLALTIEPPLPAAPASTNTVKGCIAYKLATDLAKSLNIGHYLESHSYQGYGAVVDALKFTFDANNEVMWEASGPMQSRARNAATADPTTFTTSGTTPPSGLTGGMLVNTTEEDYIRAEVMLANAMDLDNFAGGTSQARGFFRRGKRRVEVNVDSMVSDDVSVADLAEANTPTPVLLQAGETEGSIFAVYAPLTEFEVPDDEDADETTDWKYRGEGLATIAGNDELYVAFA